MKLKIEQVLPAAWAFFLALFLCFTLQDWTGAFFRHRVAITPESIQKEKNAASFKAEVPTNMELLGRSRTWVELYENGVRYPASMSSPDLVRTGEPGTWYVVQSRLEFNALADNSSPAANGRTYEVVVPDGASSKLQRFLFLLSLALTAAVFFYPKARRTVASLWTTWKPRLEAYRWQSPLTRGYPVPIWLMIFVGLSILVIWDAFALNLSFPTIAIIRDDTRGFISSPLEYFASGEFTLQWKRKFLYPMMTLVIMKIAGSINAIAIVQLAINLMLAPLIVFIVWLVGQRRIWALFLGLICAHLFIQSATTMLYSLSIMGEGFSPMMIIFTGLGFIGFLKARERRWVILSWVVMVVCCEALYYLKPNWGFGIAFPIVAILFRKILHPDFAWIPMGIYAASCAAVFLTFSATNKAFDNRYDEKRSFLAQTLFVAHLELMKPVMERDLAKGKAENPELIQEVLDRYQEALRDTERDGPGGYKRIGYNPNLLMNGDRALPHLPHFSQLTTEEQNDFQMNYFVKSVIRRPVAYTMKCLGMMEYLFDESRIFSRRRDIFLRDFLETSAVLLKSYEPQDSPFIIKHEERIAKYLSKSSERRVDTIVLREYRIYRTISRLFLALMFVVPIVALINGIVAWRRKQLSLKEDKMRKRIEIALIANGFFLLFALVIGTNAAIYTLKVNRYAEFVMPLSMLALACGLVFLVWEGRSLGGNVVGWIRAGWKSVMRRVG